MRSLKLAIPFKVVLLIAGLAACSDEAVQTGEGSNPMTNNAVTYFEIPVENLDRASRFYAAVFATELERTVIDGNDYALFRSSDGSPGASGALAKGDSYVPSEHGTRIYFSVASIDATLESVVAHGGSVAFEKTSIGELGWVAEFTDTEGNVIALHQESHGDN
ncbi:MAG: VOC family protein [Pseudomonadota bacterium]